MAFYRPCDASSAPGFYVDKLAAVVHLRRATYRRPPSEVADCKARVLSSHGTATLVPIWVAVAPVPVLRLLLSAGMGVLGSTSGILRAILRIGAAFVVVPVMVILVVPVVDSDLKACALACGERHNCRWSHERGYQE